MDDASIVELYWARNEDAIGRVYDDLIQQTDALRQQKRRPAWLKWAAVAACLCLLLGLSFPVFRPKGSVTKPAQAIAALSFNGAISYYRIDRPMHDWFRQNLD